jgi:D-alanine transaminase
MPIVKLGRETIGNGKPGAVTLRLLAEYRKLLQEGI